MNEARSAYNCHAQRRDSGSRAVAFCKLELELLGVSEVDATPVRDTSVDEYRALFLLPPGRPVEKTRTFFLCSLLVLATTTDAPREFSTYF